MFWCNYLNKLIARQNDRRARFDSTFRILYVAAFLIEFTGCCRHRTCWLDADEVLANRRRHEARTHRCEMGSCAICPIPSAVKALMEENKSLKQKLLEAGSNFRNQPRQHFGIAAVRVLHHTSESAADRPTFATDLQDTPPVKPLQGYRC
jgi:hypothetical protein